MRHPLMALGLALCVLVSPVFAHAGGRSATPKLLITDIPGDANGINDEGEPDAAHLVSGPVPALAPYFGSKGTVLPKQWDNLDILGIGFSTQFFGSGKKAKPSVLNVRLALAASPTSDTLPRVYKISFDTPRCAGNLIQWEFVPNLPQPVPDKIPVANVFIVTHSLDYTPGSVCRVELGDQTFDLPASVVMDKDLIFRIPILQMFKTQKGIAGRKITNIRAESHFRFRGAYPYPVADVAFDASKSYAIGT